MLKPRSKYKHRSKSGGYNYNERGSSPYRHPKRELSPYNKRQHRSQDDGFLDNEGSYLRRRQYRNQDDGGGYLHDGRGGYLGHQYMSQDDGFLNGTGHLRGYKHGGGHGLYQSHHKWGGHGRSHHGGGNHGGHNQENYGENHGGHYQGNYPGGNHGGHYKGHYGGNYGGNHGEHYGGNYGGDYGENYGGDYGGNYGGNYKGSYGRNHGGKYGQNFVGGLLAGSDRYHGDAGPSRFVDMVEQHLYIGHPRFATPYVINSVRSELEQLGFGTLITMPWEVSERAAILCEEYLTYNVGSYNHEGGEHRMLKVNFNKELFATMYRLPSIGHKVYYIRGEDHLPHFTHPMPKDGFMVEHVRHEKLRAAFRVLTPLFFPDVHTIQIRKMFAIALTRVWNNADEQVDWANFMEERVLKLVGNSSLGKVCFLGPYLVHALDHYGLLSVEERRELLVVPHQRDLIGRMVNGVENFVENKEDGAVLTSARTTEGLDDLEEKVGLGLRGGHPRGYGLNEYGGAIVLETPS